MMNVPADLMGKMEEEDMPVGTVFQRVLEALSREWDEGRAWLVVDSLDEAMSEGGSGIVRALGAAARSGVIPSWLGVFVTSRPEADVKSAVKGVGVGVIELDKVCDNEGDLRTWLKKQSMRDLSKEEIDAIVGASQGQFLYMCDNCCG